MPRRTTAKPVSVRLTPQIIALLPELSRLNSGRSTGDIVRRLLTQEATRLGILKPETITHVRGRKRSRL